MSTLAITTGTNNQTSVNRRSRTANNNPAENKEAAKKVRKAKSAPIATKKDALKSLRDANKETKTISGVIKTVRSFWNNGYKEAFQFLGLEFKDIDYKIIVSLWAEALKDKDGVLLYKTKVARFTEDKETKAKTYEMKDGKKVYDTVLKPYNNNFTVLKMFDALLTGKIERKEIVL